MICIDPNQGTIAIQRSVTLDGILQFIDEPDMDTLRLDQNVFAIVGAQSMFRIGAHYAQLASPTGSDPIEPLRGPIVIAHAPNHILGSLEHTPLTAEGWLSHLQRTTLFLRPVRSLNPHRPVMLANADGSVAFHHPVVDMDIFYDADFA